MLSRNDLDKFLNQDFEEDQMEDIRQNLLRRLKPRRTKAQPIHIPEEIQQGYMKTLKLKTPT